jgi:hypothetical protein
MKALAKTTPFWLRVFLFTAYTKRRHFSKRGNPNLSQNGVVLANTFIFFSSRVFL